MANKVRSLRESKNLTQTELAEKSGLSLRTVQRIEGGIDPKGFTLRAIAAGLDVATDDVFETEGNVERAKTINLSALAGLILRYGGVIIPMILTYRTKDLANRSIGKEIVGLQIVLAAILSVLMIASPFVQHALSIRFPLFIVPLVGFICLKLYVIFRNGASLNKTGTLSIKLKNNFL